MSHPSSVTSCRLLQPLRERRELCVTIQGCLRASGLLCGCEGEVQSACPRHGLHPSFTREAQKSLQNATNYAMVKENLGLDADFTQNQLIVASSFSTKHMCHRGCLV